MLLNPLVVGKMMSSNLGSIPRHNLRLKKYLCQMRDIVRQSRVYALDQNRRNSLSCTVRTSRQRSCNQRVDCLLGDKYRGNLFGLAAVSSVPYSLSAPKMSSFVIIMKNLLLNRFFPTDLWRFACAHGWAVNASS